MSALNVANCLSQLAVGTTVRLHHTRGYTVAARITAQKVDGTMLIVLGPFSFGQSWLWTPDSDYMPILTEEQCNETR